MKKNFTPKFETKLARYSAVAGTFIAAGSAQAQITYYDINPDITVANATVNIDITGDSNADFVFADTLLGSNWLAAVIPIGTQAVAGDLGSYNYPFKLALNAPIDASITTWLTGSITGSLAFNVGSTFPYSGSYWQADASDGYLGVKVDISGQTFYGWVRVSVAANTQSLIIKDLGINVMPNTQILAGATGLGMEELSGKVNMYNFNNLLTVNMIENLSNANLTVVSMTGQVVHTSAINGSTTVDLDGFAAGIYTVSLQSNEGTMVQKIMIK
jgi:hypothetical protein